MGIKHVWICTLAIALSGCASIGKDNVLFVTRTNVAIDLDLAPSTLAIGFKRDELVLAPVDENGRVLPLLTTVSTTAGVSDFGANHSFATGDAALLFSQHLLEETKLVPKPNIDLAVLTEAIGNGLPGNKIGGNRSRYLFTTNTSFGLEVSWATTQVPTAVSIGLKRKELAFVPIKKDKDASGMSHLASLLATAQASSNVGQQDETGLVIGQTFATGFAATLMATHPEVRQAMGPAIVPNWNAAVKAKKAALKFQQGKAAAKDQKVYYNAIMKAFDDTPAAQASFISKASSLGLVTSSTLAKNFGATLSKSIKPGDSSVTQKFRDLHSII